MIRVLSPFVLAWLAFCAGGCSKPGEAVAEAGAATASGTAAPAPAASASSAPSESAQSWHGSYKSVVGSLYVPPNWKGVHWAATESSAGTGDGTLALTIDPLTHRVTGTLDGPLGPAILDGLASEGKLTATIRRKDAGDRGFEGALVASIDGDHADGSMNLSLAQASAARTATFSLSPGAGGSR